MRLVFGAALIAAFAASTIPAFADAKADMTAIWMSWANVNSYHAVVTTPDGKTITYDYIKPDKRHIIAPQAEVIRIGNDMWLNQGGTWRHMPSMMSAHASTMIGRLSPAALDTDARNDYTVAFVGTEKLGAVTARHYHVTGKSNSADFDVWAGPNNLPLQFQTHGESGVTTMVFSNYNGVADITPPAM